MVASGRYVTAAVVVVLLGGLAWAVSLGLERLAGVPPEATGPPPEPPARPEEGVAHITATLYFGSSDGAALIPVQQEVALADGTVAQAREILAAQLRPAPSPHVPLIPEGTELRAFYTTERGDAFVDLSAQISAGHSGGSTTELLTVYAIVNAVAVNLPNIRRVQILVEGREVDTLAGHVDLRRPLDSDMTLVRTSR